MIMMSRAAFYYRPFVEGPDEPDLEASLQNLLAEGVVLQKGDVVMDSNERGVPSDPNDPQTDQGYRHNGIYIYDGERLNWVGEINDLFIKEDTGPNFDVFDFAPMYWAHVLNNSNAVWFDFRKNLGLANLKYLSVLPRGDGQGQHLTYQFTGKDGRLYGIVDMDEPNPTPERIQEFLRELQDEKIFRFYWNSGVDNSNLPLPSWVSPEQLLYHS